MAKKRAAKKAIREIEEATTEAFNSSKLKAAAELALKKGASKSYVRRKITKAAKHAADEIAKSAKKSTARKRSGKQR